MKFSTNGLIQLIGTAGNILNQVSGFVPEDKKWIVATILSVLQLSAGVAAHFSNPDGTSAKTAYVKA